MKRLLSYILLATLLALNNLTFTFADETLTQDQKTSLSILEKIDDKIGITINNLDNKIKDPEVKDKLGQKEEEIQKLLQETKEQIKEETSKSELSEILQETAKTITLKTVAGITPTSDITDTISSQVEIPKQDLPKAEKALVNSLENNDSYSLVLKTPLKEQEILEKLKKYDENISLSLLFEEDTNNYYELKISKDSLLRKEILENVDTGEIPNNLLGIEIVKPELLKIGEAPLSQPFPLQEKGEFVGEETDKLWGLKRYDLGKYENNIKEKTISNGKKVKVGIIDTGITYSHPDLKNEISKTITGYDFVNDDSDPTDDQGHGTHVAGTIAGEINNSGVYGVNPNVELVPLKICDSSGFCPTYGVYRAINYAIDNKLDVLNMSLGAKGNPTTSTICQAITDATNKGIIVVAASGNSNVDTKTFVPGGCQEAITVGAVDESLKRASFSNYGDKVDVSAPGVGIYSTYLNDSYKSLNGTSMATPHIVGLVSILKTYNPTITTQEVKNIFKNDAIPVTTETSKKIASFVDVPKMMNDLGIKIQDESINKETTNTGALINTGVLTNTGNLNDTNNTNTGTTNTQNTNSGILTDSGNSTNSGVTNTGSLNSGIINTNTGNLSNTGTTTEKTGSLNDLSQSSSGNINNTSSGTNTENNTNTGSEEKSPEELGLVDISTIDESIGLTIQNPEEDGTKINNVEGEKDFISEGDNENQIINLNGDETLTGNTQDNSDKVQINNVEDEVISETSEEIENEDDSNEEDNNIGVQSSYSCENYVGGTCSLDLTNANNSSLYQYSVSTSGYLRNSTTSSKVTIYLDRVGNVNFYIKKYNASKRVFEILHTIVITIKDYKALKATIGTTSIQNGNNTYLYITNGNGGYSVSSSNTNIAQVSGSNTSWTVYGKGVGIATINIRDSQNKSASVNISVTAKNLTLNTYSLNIDKGTYGYFNITDGNGGYSLTKNNSNVSGYENGSNTSYKVYGNTSGNSIINIKDSAGKTASVSINVYNPLVVTNFNQSIQKYLGETISYSVTSGNGNYIISSSNTSVASVSPNYGGTSGTITAKGVGSATITLKDGAGKSSSLIVSVKEPIKNLVVTNFNQSIQKYIGETISYSVTSGNGNYTISSSNTNVATVSPNYGGTSGTITAKGVGSATITLKDGAGKSVDLFVTVKQKYDIKLGVIYDVKSTLNKGVGGLNFKVTGNSLGLIAEIGVQYTNGNGYIEKQPLKIQKDGEYMVVYSTDSCVNCKDFKPYYTIGGSTNIANANENGTEEENNIEEYVYEGETGDTEENSQEGQVEIASSTYGMDFAGLIYTIWFWKSLFSLKQKIVDIKDKYGEYASILVSLIPAAGEGYDVLTLLLMKDPITGERLTKLDTGLTLAGLLSGVGSGGAARKAGKEALEKVAKELGMSSDEIIKIAGEVISEYKFSTIDELIASANKLKLDNFLNTIKKKLEFIPLGRGHTGRYIPNNLTEKLALEQAITNAKSGKILNITMTDNRWLAKDGWVKMSQNINGIEIHYVYNTKTKLIDDFKFKD